LFDKWGDFWYGKTIFFLLPVYLILRIKFLFYAYVQPLVIFYVFRKKLFWREKMLRRIFPVLFALALIASCTTRVNESIVIPDGKTIHKDLLTINGDIRIGNNSIVDGNCKSVNGRIVIGENSAVGDIKSVNGAVSIGKNSRVKKKIVVVNGSVEVDSQAVVVGDVATVNGSVTLTNARLLSDLVTVNGDLYFKDHSQVLGDVIVKGNSKKDEKRRIDIFLNDGSVVKGNIRVNAKNTQVLVHMRGNSKIEGDVIGAELVYD